MIKSVKLYSTILIILIIYVILFYNPLFIFAQDRIILNEQTFPDEHLRYILKTKLKANDNDDITESIKTITEIVYWRDDINKFTSFTDMEGIQHLVNLEVFEVNNQFDVNCKNLDKLGQLTKLRSMDIKGDNIAKTLTSTKIDSLEEIDIGYTDEFEADTSDLIDIANNFPNLKSLFLQYSNISDLD